MLINKHSVFSSRELSTAIIIRCFENSKKQKFISSKFRKQGKFVISKFWKNSNYFSIFVYLTSPSNLKLQTEHNNVKQKIENSHNFAAFPSKYPIERREIPPEISPAYRRKFAKTIHEIGRNWLSLLLHSTVALIIPSFFFFKTNIAFYMYTKK